MRIGIYKVNVNAIVPAHQTKGAACFDISACLIGTTYKGYSKTNASFERYHNNGTAVIMPGDRVLVPTGFIMNIPEGYSVRIHARSGLSLKQGLVLANAEGVIDSDYTDELFVMMTNLSDNPITIKHGDRIAQGELVKTEEYAIWEEAIRPSQKGDRTGGLGSTGVATAGVITLVQPESSPTIATKKGPGRPKKVAI